MKSTTASIRSVVLTTAGFALLAACGHAREAHITVDYAPATNASAAVEQPITATSTGAADAASFGTAADAPIVEDTAPPTATAPVAAPPPTQELTRPGYDAAALARARGFGLKEGETVDTITMQSVLPGSNTKGVAAIGGASSSGGTVTDARAVVAGMATGFRACYTRGLAEDPKAQGTVRLTLKIGADGSVTSTSVSGGSGLSSTVIACLQARAASATFAPPDGGKGATLVVPLTFQPS